jgi:hypothetical protein
MDGVLHGEDHILGQVGELAEEGEFSARSGSTLGPVGGDAAAEE